MINFLHTFEPSPIALSIGTFAIHWYGLFLLIGIVIGYWLVGKLASRVELSKDVVTSLYVNVLIGGLIGARIYHVLTDWGFYGNNLNQILSVWNGGLAIHGAMIGGIFTAVYFVRKNNLDFWKLADLFVIPAILGQSIGRWGNYFNQELFGRSTDSSIGIPISAINRPAGYQEFEFFHPTFLYESLINFVIFGILLFIFKKQTNPRQVRLGRNRPIGLVFWLYVGLYSAGRIAVESFRINQAAMIGDIRLPLLVSIVLAIIGVAMVLKTLAFKHKPE
ncbi:prolipoprotein diacylglyceryl transferase [bacterium]|jgi:phosphatidylglycerol:prolipoprotein diacylglycerol transferase|nr:prolipoprotein diacylglyceryl transferase [bacterium]MDP6571417.1 prolipoprotein diacylglyceryl transferase [Patescibacteria group bacterium]MDP6756396.1 prolipoprotein diacylglyceryl transferase [Patescibacteria group bacterium]|tara:strand:+ start:15700 stop:16530 length:831 start_codon:yes stop_codon:yes gene_type:complete